MLSVNNSTPLNSISGVDWGVLIQIITTSCINSFKWKINLPWNNSTPVNSLSDVICGVLYRCVTTSCINSFSSLHQFNPYLIYFVQLSVKVLRCRCLRSGFELCIKIYSRAWTLYPCRCFGLSLNEEKEENWFRTHRNNTDIKSLDCLCYLLNLTYREVILDTQEHWHWLLKTAVQYTAILHKSWNSMLFRNLFSVSYSIWLQLIVYFLPWLILNWTRIDFCDYYVEVSSAVVKSKVN